MTQNTTGHFSVRGEFSYRLLKNYVRLEGAEYRPGRILPDEASGWPGDLVGRTILALALQWRTTGREPAFLNEILESLPVYFNDAGYLGQILPAGIANEQQLSGHGWLLCGLSELYAWHGDPAIGALARGIVHNLFLPVVPLYPSYPCNAADRSFDGQPIGHIQKQMVSGWQLSTDIGCAFIPLDGLCRYYETFGDAAVVPLIESMIDSFCRIDFVGTSMQTHASLSATRGILCYGRCRDRQDLVGFAVSFFELYTSVGMTENYANYNWFGRPEWTEPCAIVDSYMLAIDLYSVTGQTQYLETANKMLFTALGHAQRENGGFGCDTCVVPGVNDSIQASSAIHYEAYWCCTMRGAEGLTKAVKASVLEMGDRFVFTNLLSGGYTKDGYAFAVDGDFPYRGAVRIEVLRCEKPTVLAFYLPMDVPSETVMIATDGQPTRVQYREGLYEVAVSAPCVLSLTFPLRDVAHPASADPTAVSYWRGYLLLGSREDAPRDLAPINDSLYRSREALIDQATKVLFDA